jgi:LCCL domain
MKVVQELVNYFDRKGKLSPKQLRKLLEQGFLAADAPATMHGLCDSVGTSYYFRVIGQVDGSLWGTDVYTGDSLIGTAAVHAGLIKPLEVAVLRVTVVTPPAQYTGSVRHGVTSHDFGRYGSAYRLSTI